MSPKSFAEKMSRIFPDGYDDVEAAHMDADELMCELLEFLGYSEGVKIFREAGKWYA